MILVVGIIPAMLLHYGVLNNYEDRAVSLRISDVSNQCKILANHLITYNYLMDTSSEVVNAELEQFSNLYGGRVLVVNNDYRVIKDTYSIAEGRIMIAEEIIKCFRGENLSNYDDENLYIELTTPILYAETEEIVGVMLTSVSTESIEETLNILTRKAHILELSMIIVLFAIAFAIALAVARPFRQLLVQLDEIRDGHILELDGNNNCYETEQISEKVNLIISRMKVLDDSRQEFVANVSHELKTPITSMKVLADSLLMQEDVPADTYKEFLKDIADEIDRENKIITDLLSLVKMDKKEALLNIEQVDINALIELILRRLRPIAAKRNIEVVFESVRPVTAEVDEVKLTLAFSNLVENAIKYNVENGWVKVVLDADHKDFTLEVSDSGIGIPKEDEEHIFERFFRVDKSHSREIGGTGLGLAITRNAVLMHRGAIQVTSIVEQGTTFLVRIPINYIV